MSGSGRGAYYKNKYGGGKSRGRGSQSGRNFNSGQQQQPYRPHHQQGGGGGYYRNEDSSSGRGRTSGDLESLLRRLDNQNYGAYKQLQGEWTFNSFTLCVDRVQGDAFASPSQMRILFSSSEYPEEAKSSPVPLCDFVLRHLHSFVHSQRLDHRQGAGAGFHAIKGGEVRVMPPAQQVVPTSAVQLIGEHFSVRLLCGLPARGRKIDSRLALQALCSNLPSLVAACLPWGSVQPQQLMDHTQLFTDQSWLRENLAARGLIAFIRDGAVLPRASGASELPLQGAVAFQSPKDLRHQFQLPSGRQVSGMGIPRGVTVIIGGGFHGKSTLLSVIEKGVYNHIGGDGRELCVTSTKAMKIRAEDGRSVSSVDVSSFISSLPFLRSDQFSTGCASGSTSMAASVQECIEAGATELLFDEDSSAANFLSRDALMMELVQEEPIRPILHQLRSLRSAGVSTVFVVGSCSDFLSHADLVLQMLRYVPVNVTLRAKQLMSSGAPPLTAEYLPMSVTRNVDPRSVDYFYKGKPSIKCQDRVVLQLGDSRVDLAGVEQIIDQYQTAAIGYAIIHCLQHKKLGDFASIRTILETAFSESIDQIQLNNRAVDGFLKQPRILDVIAALNRIRNIRVNCK